MYGSTAFDDMVLGSTAGTQTGVSFFATDCASRSPRMSASWTAASRMSKSAHDLVYKTGSCRSGGWTQDCTYHTTHELIFTFIYIYGARCWWKEICRLLEAHSCPPVGNLVIHVKVQFPGSVTTFHDPPLFVPFAQFSAGVTSNLPSGRKPYHILDTSNPFGLSVMVSPVFGLSSSLWP